MMSAGGIRMYVHQHVDVGGASFLFFYAVYVLQGGCIFSLPLLCSCCAVKNKCAMQSGGHK